MLQLIAKKVNQIMVGDVMVVRESDPLVEIIGRLAANGISCIVIVDDRKPVGIISERDIVRILSNGDDCMRLDAGSVMSSPVHTVRSEASLDEAVNLMQEKKFRRFPVVADDGTLVGLITQSNVVKAVDHELRKHVKDLEKIVKNKTKELSRLSMTDELTGLHNRRYLKRKLSEELGRAKRYGIPLSCALLDIDNFKEVNDKYGHHCGDNVLAELGQLIRSNIRTVDACARYGGDEMFLIFPHTRSSSAEVLGERLRKVVEEHQFACGDHKVSMTVTLGFCHAPSPEIDDSEDLIRVAAQMLREAKAKGGEAEEIDYPPFS